MLSCCQSLADEPTLVRRYNGQFFESDLLSQPASLWNYWYPSSTGLHTEVKISENTHVTNLK